MFFKTSLETNILFVVRGNGPGMNPTADPRRSPTIFLEENETPLENAFSDTFEFRKDRCYQHQILNCMLLIQQPNYVHYIH